MNYECMKMIPKSSGWMKKLGKREKKFWGTTDPLENLPMGFSESNDKGHLIRKIVLLNFP